MGDQQAKRAFISVGSNIEPEQNIPMALQTLNQAVRITGISTFYRTKALGFTDQPSFINGVIEIETTIPPSELKFQVLRPIETKLGRRRTENKNAPRPIDLDLIWYDNLLISDKDLVIPDPQIPERPFLAIPLDELDSNLTLSGMNRSVHEIALEFFPHSMEPLDQFTAALKETICVKK